MFRVPSTLVKGHQGHHNHLNTMWTQWISLHHDGAMTMFNKCACASKIKWLQVLDLRNNNLYNLWIYDKDLIFGTVEVEGNCLSCHRIVSVREFYHLLVGMTCDFQHHIKSTLGIEMIPTELDITDNQGTNQDTYGYSILLYTTESYIIESAETIIWVICVVIILILIPFCIKKFGILRGQQHQHHHIEMNL